MTLLKNKSNKKSIEHKNAREIDRERTRNTEKTSKPVKNKKRTVKRTTLHTMPYESMVSDYIMLLKSNVKVGKEYANLYSKTYNIPDINYSSLTEEEQLKKLQIYIELLNGFDSNVSLQLSIVNSQINIDEFEEKMLIRETEEQYEVYRQELNNLMRKRVMEGKNGLRCRKYITVTVVAIDFETAASRLYTIESHMVNCLNRIGTKAVPLDANQRMRLIADILRNPNDKIDKITQHEFARQEEKMLCCPDYFEFKKDYFLFNDKFARCLYFRRLPASVLDTVYKELTELNIEMIISENVEFVDVEEAQTMLQRKITDMHQEEISKTRKAAQAAKGGFVDPITGTQLDIDKTHAQEFLDDLQHRNQKMTLCQFIVMIISDSFEDMKKNTDLVNIVLRKQQIEPINAPYRQEQAFDSALPVGNSCSYDKDKNIQVRRTLSSESTAAFMPFNVRELNHRKGMLYGLNQLSKNVIMFDRRKLYNPNGFIFGVPGSGKSMAAKLEMFNSVLNSSDEILIIDPEREYVNLAQALGGEVIKISANTNTYINPLDLTPNYENDKEYDPIKSKYDFLLSFFATILGDVELSPIFKTIIDTVMRKTYDNNSEPTLKEFYSELEKYESEVESEIKTDVTYLRQTLHLYAFGSMEVFSHKSNIDINKRIVVYDIKDLGKNLNSLGMTIVLENVWNRVACNRSKGINTRVYIDEMYLMFKNEQSASFFYECWKRLRKWGGIPTGITQNVEDLLRSEMARTMLANTQFVVMLAQNATDRIQLADILKIPDDTMKYVTNSNPGSGLIFAAGYGIIPFENTFPSDTQIYKTITTKFNDTALDLETAK